MTTRSLLMLGIGPVQSFIAAARRTRDIWYGSDLLSRIARAAALSLEEAGAQLVLPAPSVLHNGHPAAVANKIVCVLPSSDLQGALREAREAATQVLTKEGESLIRGLRSEAVVDAVLLMDQLRDALEFYAGWAPIQAPAASQPEAAAYQSAYTQAGRWLDGRKRLRNFAPNLYVGGRSAARSTVRHGLALSSLDGERESVLLPDAQDWRARYQIDTNEGLDALGLLKRVLGRKSSFPAVTRVALQPWVERWPEDARARVALQLRGLAALNPGLARETTAGQTELLSQLPYDAEVLLPHRRSKLRESASDEEQTALDKLSELLAERAADGSLLCNLPDGEGTAVAMLLADGDHMGELLSNERCGLAEHQALSAAMAAFAAKVREIVAQHGGACIYAGGDDVMALLPVPTAIQAARRLSEEFALALGPHAPAGAPQPTLSVGVACAGVLAPLGQLRALAWRALGFAKDGKERGPDGESRRGDGLRNALAVLVQPRGGAEALVVGAWDQPNPGSHVGLDARLAFWVQRFADGTLPQGTPYDLWQLVHGTDPLALPDEAKALLARRGAGHDQDLARMVAHSLQGATSVAIRLAHDELAAEWYVARWLAGQRPNP